ncbi:unnamed protein product [Adineta steineri]|uniref:MULE transposase domain-containing protein n=1 Tax=Adineta steineri TaxID=433720 RepID=A0A815RQP9_9BILA|nr:unnamed protein product [Adineta steineri]CAF1481029.1 unnamed protein product [Adineta steineri]CAF3642804.1 unnamed protein product [Adineta steineri]CAF4149440.1 unnamed protein product [Adineta steineri]
MNKRTSTKTYWICKTRNCKAHIHTDLNDNFLYSSGEHNHLLEPEELEVKHFRDILKERVVNETTPISKIYDEEIMKARFSPEVLASVPLVRAIGSGLNQARRKLTPVLPTSATFDIPDSYQTTTSGEKFLFCDTVVGRKKRMILFGSPKQLELLFDSTVILMDGTFTATPPFFDQVYTLHALKFDCDFPCVFGLLPDRKKSTYQILFQELKTVAQSMNRVFQPERIISDFESSLMPAIASEFPQTTHSGCYFHFNQSIYRRIQNLGLATAYSNDDEIRDCCRKLMSLALMPINEVESSFYSLRASLSSKAKQELRQLLLYFDSYWMTQVPLKMWNVYDFHHRTNNNCEGFHNRLNRRIERAHSNIWSFVRCLLAEESRFQHMYVQINIGAQPRVKSKLADTIQKRINTLKERYNNQQIDAEQLLSSLALLVAKTK